MIFRQNINDLGAEKKRSEDRASAGNKTKYATNLEAVHVYTSKWKCTWSVQDDSFGAFSVSPRQSDFFAFPVIRNTLHGSEYPVFTPDLMGGVEQLRHQSALPHGSRTAEASEAQQCTYCSGTIDRARAQSQGSPGKTNLRVRSKANMQMLNALSAGYYHNFARLVTRVGKALLVWGGELTIEDCLGRDGVVTMKNTEIIKYGMVFWFSSCGMVLNWGK